VALGNQRQKAQKVRQKSGLRKKKKSRDEKKSVRLVEVNVTKAIGGEEIAVIIIIIITTIVVAIAIMLTTGEIVQVSEGLHKAVQVEAPAAVACVQGYLVLFTKRQLQLSLPALN